MCTRPTPPIRFSDTGQSQLTRRAVGGVTAAGALSAVTAATFGAPERKAKPIVDTHMHVWAGDTKRYPMVHPYAKEFRGAPHPATLEMLIADMDRHGCSHAVLVQCIYHGWDNRYVADCGRRYPKRLRVHGLIDPTDPKVAGKLEYWMKEHGLHGMRFSPIYYRDGKHGGDSWLNAPQTHRLWRMAEKLGAIFNFFIAPTQLPKLATMVRAHPNVPVIVDHLSQMDLGVADPEPQMRLLLQMARHRSVRVKVSELASVSKSKKYPYVDAYPYVKRVYEAFGPDRLLFGTGYPGAARAGYDRPPLDKEIDLVDRYSFMTEQDRAKMLGQNAIGIWGFEL